jgi:hypothetical protein
MPETNPFAILEQMAGGYCLPRCLHVVADLGVADAIDDFSKTAAELAATVDAHPDALHRVLRLLSAHGVFSTDGQRFSHSPASRLLRTDHPQSMRSFVRMFGLSSNWATFEELHHTIKTGLPAAEKALPGGFWEYLSKNTEAAGIFNAAMSAKAQAHVPMILAAYDFSRFQRIADIGGGRGHLLCAVLDATPNLNGVLFDLPHVVEESASFASERLTLQGGDFFKDTLPSSDAYLLMEVIHDWGDEESIGILNAIRTAAHPGATLLLIEQIVPDDPGPHWTKLLDIHMMAYFAARQRTTQEYETLLSRAGFHFAREIETGAGISILEATV